MNAIEQILLDESRRLAIASSLLGETLEEKREVLQQIATEALKQLEAGLYPVYSAE